jgi:hypothetical protein
MPRVRNDGTNAADAQRSTIQHPRQIVLSGAGEQVLAIPQGHATLMDSSPRGLHLGRQIPVVRDLTQAFVSDRRRDGALFFLQA